MPICPKCPEKGEQDESAFYVRRGRHDKTCKECVKAKRRAERAKLKPYTFNQVTADAFNQILTRRWL